MQCRKVLFDLNAILKTWFLRVMKSLVLPKYVRVLHELLVLLIPLIVFINITKLSNGLLVPL